MFTPNFLKACFFCFFPVLTSCTADSISNKKTRANIYAQVSSPQCEYQPGSGGALILIGKVALGKDEVVPREVYIVNGVIDRIAPIGEITKENTNAARLSCKNAFFSPGLVNAHEHTGFSYRNPDVDMENNYQHRLEWRKGGKRAFKEQPESTSNKSILAWVELRHLLSGTTTVVGSGGVAGIVRNVSSRNNATDELVDLKTDPFDRDQIKSLQSQCDNSQNASAAIKLDHKQVHAVPHVGEGVNCLAEKELDAYVDYIDKNPHRNFSLIHGVMLQEKHHEILKKHDASVIWSPRSNVALYSKSLNPVPLLDKGIRVALGTDWSPSGSFNMFEEMRCAKSYSAAKSVRAVSDPELWAMSTINGAQALGLEDKIGAIDVGNFADIIVVDDPEDNELAAFSEKKAVDILAVFVGGKLMAGETRFSSYQSINADCTTTTGSKFVCINFNNDFQKSFADIATLNKSSVDLLNVNKQAECKFP